MEWTGTVERRLLRRGTKSEHEGLVLVTAKGEYKLRRINGNPFWDETLAGLEGRRIRCTAELEGNEVLMSDWEVIA